MRHKFLSKFWKKSVDYKLLSFFEKFFFKILCFAEKLYLIVFSISCFFKKKFGSKVVRGFKVISVGNLSCGGTGKSVFVQFLVNNLINHKAAVVSRGYKSLKEKSGQSFLVGDGKKLFLPAKLAGDEPYMLASSLNVPVVIGKNRFKSALLLEKFCVQKNRNINCVVLDDAYQNFQLKKDLDVLLLDARAPFENGHCLPAGKLREKDFSRADVIILTHADKVSAAAILEIKNKDLKSCPEDKTFAAAHKFSELLHLNLKPELPESFQDKSFLAFAGIGNFDYFIQSVNDLKIKVLKAMEYSDHHAYSLQDLKHILKQFEIHNCCGIITTSKDWYKIFPLLKTFQDWENLPIYVLQIKFEFLTEKEKIRFLSLVEEIL